MSTQFTISRQSENHRAITSTTSGIRYEIFDHRGVVSVRRWNAATDKNIIVGEFKLSFIRRDAVRFGSDTQWRPVNQFLYNPGSLFSLARSFTGDDGIQYRWKVRQGTLTLCKSGRGEPALVTVHRDRYPPRNGFLEVHDADVLQNLDKIIVSFLIMEQRL